MPALAPSRIRALINPYFPDPAHELLEQLSTYLDLLLKWNARTNLSAIRDPEQIVQRHFGESLFTARHLPPASTLLDLGSGAGFPGLPIALAHPLLTVTLAESQNKKASFLREAVRTLNLQVVVWPNRAETLPTSRRFDIVTLRAVDNPNIALATARQLLTPGGAILHLTAKPALDAKAIPMPNSTTFLDIFR
jgi:16S rRNA (guanine527-N7)-methyltransferase